MAKIRGTFPPVSDVDLPADPQTYDATLCWGPDPQIGNHGRGGGGIVTSRVGFDPRTRDLIPS